MWKCGQKHLPTSVSEFLHLSHKTAEKAEIWNVWSSIDIITQWKAVFAWRKISFECLDNKKGAPPTCLEKSFLKIVVALWELPQLPYES